MRLEGREGRSTEEKGVEEGEGEREESVRAVCSSLGRFSEARRPLGKPSRRLREESQSPAILLSPRDAPRPVGEPPEGGVWEAKSGDFRGRRRRYPRQLLLAPVSSQRFCFRSRYPVFFTSFSPRVFFFLRGFDVEMAVGWSRDSQRTSITRESAGKGPRSGTFPTRREKGIWLFCSSIPCEDARVLWNWLFPGGGERSGPPGSQWNDLVALLTRGNLRIILQRPFLLFPEFCSEVKLPPKHSCCCSERGEVRRVCFVPGGSGIPKGIGLQGEKSRSRVLSGDSRAQAEGLKAHVC